MQKVKNRPASKNKITTATTSTEEDIEVVPTKIKRPIDLELPEELVSPDEKVVDENAPVDEDSEDLTVSEPTLDDDELNPFGDKWEE